MLRGDDDDDDDLSRISLFRIIHLLIRHKCVRQLHCTSFKSLTLAVSGGDSIGKCGGLGQPM